MLCFCSSNRQSSLVFPALIPCLIMFLSLSLSLLICLPSCTLCVTPTPLPQALLARCDSLVGASSSTFVAAAHAQRAWGTRGHSPRTEQRHAANNVVGDGHHGDGHHDHDGDDDDDDVDEDASAPLRRLRVGAHVLVRAAGDDDAITTLLGGVVGE